VNGVSLFSTANRTCALVLLRDPLHRDWALGEIYGALKDRYAPRHGSDRNAYSEAGSELVQDDLHAAGIFAAWFSAAPVARCDNKLVGDDNFPPATKSASCSTTTMAFYWVRNRSDSYVVLKDEPAARHPERNACSDAESDFVRSGVHAVSLVPSRKPGHGT
jgi:hypothetical protein